MAVVVALAAAAGVWATWRVFVTTATGQAVDHAAYDGAAYGQNTLWQVAEPVLEVVSVWFVVVGTAAAVVVALVRRRWFLALQVAVLVAGANLTTQVLKSVIERPDLGPGVWPNSFPSGHTTVAASFAAAMLLAVPRRARAWVALVGAAYTAATGVSTLIAQWHRPSDALGAVLVVLAWTAFVCAIGPSSAGDPPPPTGATSTALATVTLAVGAGVTGAIAAWGLASALADERAGIEIESVPTYAAGALSVVAAAAGAFAVMLLVRQSTARRVVR